MSMNNEIISQRKEYIQNMFLAVRNNIHSAYYRNDIDEPTYEFLYNTLKPYTEIVDFPIIQEVLSVVLDRFLENGYIEPSEYAKSVHTDIHDLKEWVENIRTEDFLQWSNEVWSHSGMQIIYLKSEEYDRTSLYLQAVQEKQVVQFCEAITEHLNSVYPM